MPESRNNYKKLNIRLDLINELRARSMTREDIRNFLSAKYISFGKVPSKCSNILDYKVHDKTVKRELDAIEEIYGDQLECQQGVYKLDLRDFPDSIDDTEIQALDVAIKKMGNNRTTKNILEQLKAKLTTKLYNNINRKESKKTAATRKINEIDQKINADFAFVGPHRIINFDVDVKSVLDSAIMNLHEVRFNYKNSDKIVQPLGIMYGPNNVYLIAYPKEKKEPWHYILSDIKDAVETNISFEPGDFSIQKYANSMFGVYDDGKVYCVEWLIKKPELTKIVKHYQFHSTQEFVNNLDGTLTIKMRTGGLYAMCIYLTQWGGDIIPTKPKELVVEYKKLLKKCLDSMKS
ncbi:MAG: WYL domain-containing protein [Alphaproteobacteria bacterium]|nr:WYL domain-containing protein [Alphaproteobacteria bacterium]